MNLAAYLQARNVKFKRRRGKHGEEYSVNCPFCLRNIGKPDTHMHLGVNPDMGVYNCFRCGEGGDIHDLYSDWRHVEATGQTQGLAPAPLPEAELPGTLVPLTSLPDDHQCIQYLRARHFNPELLEKLFGVRYCQIGRSYIHGLFNTSNTLVFPIWMGQKLVGWQSRLLYTPDELPDDQCELMGWRKDDNGGYVKPPKYFTAPNMDKGRVMFNYDTARASDVVVICEGPFDAAATGPSAVATMGKGISEAQIRLIKAYWKLAVILLDPGDADREMLELQGNLQMSMATIRMNLTGYKDAGDCPTLEIWRQIHETAIAHNINLYKYNLGPYWNEKVFSLRT